MTDVSKAKSRQPEALAELAKTARETTPGDGDRQLTASADNRPNRKMSTAFASRQ
jgi:hypothetical protein